MPRWDVVVVGAGPAGAATAIALRSLGVDRVALLDDGRAAARPAIGESIPPETRLLVDQLGVWAAFSADGHEPCLGSASCWGSPVPGYNDFVCNPHGSGWHLDRARFDTCLRRQAVATGTRVRSPVRIVDARRGRGDRVVLGGSDGDVLEAHFVVDATGGTAAVARMLGARRVARHRLTCAAGFLNAPAGSALHRMTVLEAVEYGWWYAARVPGDRASVVVAADPGELTRRALHTAGGWLDHLGATALVGEAVQAGLPGGLLGDGTICVRGSSSSALDPCVGDGWAAVGDAASVFDPLSSQGIYKALADAVEAAAAIAAWLDGNPKLLAQYGAGVEARTEEYERLRSRLYGLERRWPNAPFWRARHKEEIARHAASRPSTT